MTMEIPEVLRTSARFKVHRCLGSGAFGVVYAAYDNERGSEVALKWLKNGDGSMITRFKREFRSLADLTHPNLVRFRDLIAMDDTWFFTMDLLDGVDFLDYAAAANRPLEKGHSSTSAARPPSSTVAAGRMGRTPEPEAVENIPMTKAAPDPNRPLCAADLGRLGSALEQLAAGLSAIHSAGMLHRGVKPSNVLVTDEGRLVLLDFGMVTELGVDGVAETLGDRVVGTPAYMSPEQGLGRPLTAASDWYAVCATRPPKARVMNVTWRTI
jgi:eukaryotic-like serine/threonine-protein kinase